MALNLMQWHIKEVVYFMRVLHNSSNVAFRRNKKFIAVRQMSRAEWDENVDFLILP